MGKFADKLAARLQGQVVWPHPKDDAVWKQCRIWVAMRESDRDALRHAAKWQDASRKYLVDPLPEKISQVFAEMIFRQPPSITPVDPEDKDAMTAMLDENELAQELQRWEEVCSSEGEVWWRICADTEGFNHPILEFWSRLDVVPLFVSNKLKAVAFIDVLETPSGGVDAEEVVWRHFEIIDDETIRNVLFSGTDTTIGEERSLDSHPETKDLESEVEHDLPAMPAGRIANKMGKSAEYGRSDYDGIEDYIYGLNEALTIGSENARLTLKRRVVVPASAVDESGNLPANQEAIVVESSDMAMGRDSTGAGQFKVLEYSFDADNLIKYQNSLAEAGLSRVGISVSYAGLPSNQSEGRAITGTALRLKLLPQTNAGDARGGYWDASFPTIFLLMQILDARPTGEVGLAGFGNTWKEAGKAPGVDRGSSLPEDPVEEAQRHSVLVAAHLESVKTAIKELHPDWDEKQVDEEYEAIVEDTEAFSSSGIGGKLFGGSPRANTPDLPPAQAGALPPVSGQPPPAGLDPEPPSA